MDILSQEDSERVRQESGRAKTWPGGLGEGPGSSRKGPGSSKKGPEDCFVRKNMNTLPKAFRTLPGAPGPFLELPGVRVPDPPRDLLAKPWPSLTLVVPFPSLLGSKYPYF